MTVTKASLGQSISEGIGMREYVLGAILAALLIAVPALAQTASPGSQAAHQRRSFFTSNESRADVAARVAKTFGSLDANHDGFVTRDEIAASQSRFDARASKSAPKRAARMFARMDTDHDGKVTLAEAETARSARLASRGKQAKPSHAQPALFKLADANKDGTVTRAEFDAAIVAGKIKPRRAHMHGNAIVRELDSADANKDGRLSLEEAQLVELRRFDAADLDHDGVLTPDERRRARKNAGAPRSNAN
jgi:hypothetical protein